MTAVVETHVAPAQSGAPMAIADAQVTVSEDLVSEDLVVEELLVEDVSIDGMCGVY